MGKYITNANVFANVCVRVCVCVCVWGCVCVCSLSSIHKWHQFRGAYLTKTHSGWRHVYLSKNRQPKLNATAKARHYTSFIYTKLPFLVVSVFFLNILFTIYSQLLASREKRKKSVGNNRHRILYINSSIQQ